MIKNEIFACFVTDMNDKVDYVFRVYLINGSEHDYHSVKLLTGAFCEDIETSKVLLDRASMKSGAFLQIDLSDRWELDFVIWYLIDLIDSNGEMFQYRFSIPKYDCMNEKLWENIPILNKQGFFIPLMQRDGKSIDNIVQDLKEPPKRLPFSHIAK